MAPRKKRPGLIVVAALAGLILCCGKLPVRSNRGSVPVQFKSAVELAGSIRRGEITSSELLELYLERIHRYNDEINAVVALDIDAARERAALADKAIAEGRLWGPLHGLPMTVKDVFEVVGMPATSGDPVLEGYLPQRNAAAVQRLIDAGAIVFGKTNVPYHAMDIQSYNDIYGTTNNPWDLSRTPGGSSGGSAAALAAGLTALELGSDLAGSVRFPAHYTGVFGHKPTFGLIPRYGHVPPMPGRVTPELMPSIPLFVVGPLARSAEDLDLALSVLAAGAHVGEDKGAPGLLPPPRKKRFDQYRAAVWFTDSYSEAEIDAEVSAALEKTVAKLRAAGLELDAQARPDLDLFHMNYIYNRIFDFLVTASLPIPERLAAEQAQIQAKWADFFEHYDVLLAPVSPTIAFPHDHRGTILTRHLTINGSQKPMLSNMVWSRMASVAGLPATVAPVGLSRSGLPVGIQIIGARMEDRTTIAFARGLSELTGGFVPPPHCED